MKTLNKMMVVAAVSSISFSAMANDAARAASKQIIDLKDGSTLYVFNDGKMAMESPYGRAVRMQEGTTMEAKDGQKLIMTSDEVARLNSLIRQGHTGGR
jgi:hypothetical protein